MRERERRKLRKKWKKNFEEPKLGIECTELWVGWRTQLLLFFLFVRIDPF